MRSRFTELDGLRGIAALAVVVYHFTGAYNSRYSGDPRPTFDFLMGAFGVQLFFLISGFVILMSVVNVKRPSDFVIFRISRIYPAYWLSLAMALVVIHLFDTPGERPTAVEALINLTMVQRWLLAPNVVEVYWTLAVELQFYVLMFMLLLITRCRVTDRIIVGVSILWLVIAVLVALWAGPSSRGLDPQNVETLVKIVLNLSLAEYGPLFCCGMLSYLARVKHRFYPLVLLAAVASVGVAALLHSLEYALTVSVVCAGFLMVALRERTSWLNLPPLQWFGKVSYSVYIVHSVVGYVVIRIAWPFVGRDGAIVVAIMAVTVVAWATYVLGEKHGTAFLKRLLLHLRERRVQADNE